MLTQDNLRSGLTYWRALGPDTTQHPPLEGDTECETLVVGGGITGTLVAGRLCQAGVQTLLIDREHPAVGSTAASTGLLQYEIDTPLIELIEKVGRDHAVHAYRRGLLAIDELEDFASGLAAPCGFSRKMSLYLASSQADVPKLREEARCRQHYGFDLHLLEGGELRELSGMNAPAAVWSTGDAQINPYRFTQLGLQKAVECGVRVHGETAVESVEETPFHVEVQTNRGRVRARNVIFATGYAAHERLGGIGKLHTTYAAVSAPTPFPTQWPERCLIWETARPYSYARTLDDGRVMIGGEDTSGPFDHESDSRIMDKTARLVERYQTLFPGAAFEPEFAWAGTFGESDDGLPYIGRPPGRERIYYALGYGGNGITFSTIAARLLTDLVLGRPNDDAVVFRFGR